MRNGKKPPFQNHFWNYPPPNPTFVKLLNTGRNLISLSWTKIMSNHGKNSRAAPKKNLLTTEFISRREFNLKTFPIFLFIVFWKLSRPSKRKFRGKKDLYFPLWNMGSGTRRKQQRISRLSRYRPEPRCAFFSPFLGFLGKGGMASHKFPRGWIPFSLENPAKLFRKLVPSYILFPHECTSDKYRRIFFPGETEGWKRSLICLSSLFGPFFVRETHMRVGKKNSTPESRGWVG